MNEVPSPADDAGTAGIVVGTLGIIVRTPGIVVAPDPINVRTDGYVIGTHRIEASTRRNELYIVGERTIIAGNNVHTRDNVVVAGANDVAIE